jgi:hypothetical protein
VVQFPALATIKVLSGHIADTLAQRTTRLTFGVFVLTAALVMLTVVLVWMTLCHG